MGGVFNAINLNLYHYAGDNPVKFVDPDGKHFAFYVNDNRAPSSNPFDGSRIVYNGHTSLYFQDFEGLWYRFDQWGEGEPSLRLFYLGYMIFPLKAKVSITKVEGPPEGALIVPTSADQDKKIYEQAMKSKELHNSGKKSYHLTANSCTDSSVDVVNDADIGIEIPNSAFTLRPITWKNEYIEWYTKNYGSLPPPPKGNDPGQAESKDTGKKK